ncbi:hypothetical protein G6011_08771 [Alternaria panax]|uniref:Uncharacterized protein n=1 Tax=Alternaria panax TaxID=48097 RepID=A0AAD4FKL0_9PLEO|nr:hypothetical protein G6011_08771 [Alternaria panax]
MIYSSKVMDNWRQQPKVSPDSSPSPPTTRPTTPTSPASVWGRPSSSSLDWRSGSLPRPISHQAVLPPFKRLEDGYILYIPPAPIPSSSIIRRHSNQSQFEDHPIVVLGTRRDAGDDIVMFRHIASFGGVPVEEKKSKHLQGFFMLCENSQDKGKKSTNPIAKMALGPPLKKRSYVNLSHNSFFEIEYRYLAPFHGELRRLDAESVAFIKKAPCST